MMTEKDKALIEKASSLKRYYYEDIYALIDQADTPEARRKLREIQIMLYDSCMETL